MDASCKIQGSIHGFRLVYKYVSRILGTYHSPILRRAALLDLCRMETNKFPLSQWQDSVRYLTGIEKDFASIEEIKAFLRNEVKL